MALVKKKADEKALVAASTWDNFLDKKKVDNRKVLDEEVFVSDLEKIIQRDFFPDLKKLKAQQEYMEAMERNDLVRMRELAIKYASTCRTSRPGTSSLTPMPEGEQTPSTFETPVPGQFAADTPRTVADDYKNEDKPPENVDLTEEKPASDTSLTLDRYLTRYTSEDNASFGEIMAQSQEKHKQKHAWLYEAELGHGAQQEEMLRLKGGEELAVDARSNSLNGWRYQPKNALMYVPDGVELSLTEKVQKKREKEISHVNTRLTTDPFAGNEAGGSLTGQAGPSRGDGRVGPDGKEAVPSDGPKVNGYGFIATPSPAPGVNESPMMTWGEIEGTPFRLDGGDTPMVSTVRGPQFKMPGVPRKERLGLSLVDMVTKKNRAKKEQALKRVTQNLVSPSPKRFGSVNSVERIRTLSSAAQKLVQRSVGSTDKALRASYTPSPQRSAGGRTPSIGGTPNRTPGSTPGKSPATRRSQRLGASPASTRSQAEPASLTDNLLNLPKRTAAPSSRQKATDFF